MARSGVRELPDASFRQSIEVRPAQQLACYDVSLSIVRDRSQLQVLPDLRRLPIAVAQPLPASSGRSLGRHSHGTEAKRAGASTGSITARRNKVVKDATAERRAKGIWLGGQARGRDSPCTSPGGDKGGPAPRPSLGGHLAQGRECGSITAQPRGTGPKMREGQSLNIAQKRQGRSSSGGPSLRRHLRGSEARNAGSPTGSIGGRLAGNVATDSKARSAAVGRSGTIHRQHHCRPGCQHAQQSLGRSGHHPSPTSLPAGMATRSPVPLLRGRLARGPGRQQRLGAPSSGTGRNRSPENGNGGPRTVAPITDWLQPREVSRMSLSPSWTSSSFPNVFLTIVAPKKAASSSGSIAGRRD